MRVLDVGCGTGETTFQLAQIVGTSGAAMGVEADHEAIRTARSQADKHWVANVEFHESGGAEEWLLGLPPFDAVVGRLYLVRQSDPAAVLRRLARLVRPGGVLAFVEAELDFAFHAEPAVPLVQQALGWLQAGYREAGAQMNLVTNLPRVFLEAGLGWPQVRLYQSAAGSGSAEAPGRLAAAIGDLPASRRHAGEWGALAGRLAEATAPASSVTAAAPLAGAWARSG